MKLTVVLLAVAGVVGNWSIVRGETVSYEFTGRVVESFWEPLNGFPVGDNWLPEINDGVVGRIVLDTSVPLRRPDYPPLPPLLPFEGVYVGPANLELTIDGHRWSNSVFNVTVVDDQKRLDGTVEDLISLYAFSMGSSTESLGDSVFLALQNRGGDLFRDGSWTRDLTMADVESGERTSFFASMGATGPPLWFSIETWDRIANRLQGDFDGDSVLTVADVNALAQQTRTAHGRPSPDFDFTGDRWASSSDVRELVHLAFGTYVGDANLDKSFDSNDLLTVFQANQFEDVIPLNSDWATGDWDGNGEFDASDLVMAFQDGGYEAGPRAAISAAPEPCGFILFGVGVIGGWRRRRHAKRK